MMCVCERRADRDFSLRSKLGRPCGRRGHRGIKSIERFGTSSLLPLVGGAVASSTDAGESSSVSLREPASPQGEALGAGTVARRRRSQDPGLCLKLGRPCGRRGPHPSAAPTPSPKGKVTRCGAGWDEPHQSGSLRLPDSFPLARGSPLAQPRNA